MCWTTQSNQGIRWKFLECRPYLKNGLIIGQISIQSEPRSGKPSTSRNEQIIGQVQDTIHSKPLFDENNNCKWRYFFFIVQGLIPTF